MAGAVKRRYQSERRREQARQTRDRVLEAAAALFAERGYDATSVAAIAESAGVADETVYSHFGNKRTLLGELMQAAVRGGDPRPVPEQDAPRALATSRDRREQLHLFADDVSQRLQRAAPLVAVVAAAARSEPELADLYGRLHADRLRNLRILVDALGANGPLALPAAEAVETVWALTSPELHQLLTDVRGWSRARYVRWLESSLAALLLVD